MTPKEHISVEELRAWLAYDAGTGALTWLQRPCQRVRAGDVAGSFEGGYVRVRVCGRKLLAHRIAWALAHGHWPKARIDHHDLCKTNNRLENLREATTAENARNRPANRCNKLGVKGVFQNKRDGRFYAQIRADGRRVHLGVFASCDEAASAYAQAAAKLHGEFANAGGIQCL